MGGEGSFPKRASAWSDMTGDDLPGTAIKSVDEVPHITFEPRLTYRWDDGYALTTYLDGFAHGKIRASYCAGCDRMLIPSRAFCELCNLRSVDRYFDMPDTGVIETFTISHVDWASAPLPDGEVNILDLLLVLGRQLLDFLFVSFAQRHKIADVQFERGAEFVEAFEREIASGKHVFDGRFGQAELSGQPPVRDATRFQLSFQRVDYSC